MTSNFSIPQITILKRTREDLAFAQKKFLKKTKKGRVVKSKISFPFRSSSTKAQQLGRLQSYANVTFVPISLVVMKHALSVHRILATRRSCLSRELEVMESSQVKRVTGS